MKKTFVCSFTTSASPGFLVANEFDLALGNKLQVEVDYHAILEDGSSQCAGRKVAWFFNPSVPDILDVAKEIVPMYGDGLEADADVNVIIGGGVPVIRLGQAVTGPDVIWNLSITTWTI